MKKLLISVLMLLALSSCGKLQDDPFERFLAQRSYHPKSGMIWDFSPTEVRITLSDSQGNDLLDPKNEGGWYNLPISATFDGKTFEGINKSSIKHDDLQTKYYLATLRGFYMYPLWYTHTDRYILYFGELDSADKWDHDLVISWPDGTKDVIRVQHAFRWDINGNPDMYTGFKLNGKAVEGGIIRLQK